MMSFAARKFGEQIHAAWQDFNLSETPESFEESSLEHEIFMPYFLFQWDPEGPSRRRRERGKGGVVARWYMLEKAKYLTARDRLFLEQATTQPMSFFEVLWVEPGARMAVRDVLIGGEVEVIERSASRTLRQGDVIYAQIWHQPELAVLGCCAPLAIPPDKKVQVIELRKKLRRRIAKQNRALTADDLLRYADLMRATYVDIRTALNTPPRFCNTDGDPLVLHTLTFRIESPEATFEKLAPLSLGRSREELLQGAELDENGKLRKVNLDWVREGNRKFKTWDNTVLGHIRISESHVIGEVNSEKRAARLRKEIEKRLGPLAVHQHTRVQELAEMLKGERRKAAHAESQGAEADALLLDPEVRKKLQETVQREVEGWVYQKVPALGGRTPIEAVHDPDGREMVEALLLQWERQAMKGVSPGKIRPDINVVRRLLNLAPSAS